MLQQTNVQPIQKAVMIIHQMSEDEKIQELARLREKAMHDEASALSSAKKEGLAEGRDKREAELVESMRKNGLSEEQISKILSGL